MSRDHKISLRMNDSEYHYVTVCSARANMAVSDFIRRAVHERIISLEGEPAAVHLLRGDPPGRAAPR